MEFYKVWGLTLEANVPLPALPAQGTERPDCTFRLLPAGPLSTRSGPWLQTWRLRNRRVWLTCAKNGPGYLLRFPRVAEFHLVGDGHRIECRPAPETLDETVRHLLLNQVIPLVLSRREKLVLHASVVLVSGEAVAFVGVSGAGKSTLAASFYQAGFPVLADDCLVLDHGDGQLRALAGYPGLRLWPDVLPAFAVPGSRIRHIAHDSMKRRVEVEPGQMVRVGPVPLKCIYILARSDRREAGAIAVVRLSGRHALIELLRHAYRLDITDREYLKGQLDQLVRACQLASVRVLAYPHDYSMLEEVQGTVLDDLRM